MFGQAALLNDGSVIGFSSGRGEAGTIREIRLYRREDAFHCFDSLANAERGVFPRLPTRIPQFPGYRHHRSAWLEANGYVGIWHRAGRSSESLVAAYIDGESPAVVILGRSQARLGAITGLMRMHGRGPFEFIVTSQAQIGQPLHYVVYRWNPSRRPLVPSCQRPQPEMC